MTAGDFRAALLAPVLAYAALVELLAPWPHAWPVLAGVVAAACAVLAAPSPQRIGWPFLPWGGLALVAVGLFFVGPPHHLAYAQALAVGVIVGAPLVALSWLVLWRDSLPATLFNGPMSLATGGFTLAVVRALPAGAASPGVAAWWGAITHIASLQWYALTGAIAAAQAPLGYLGDTIFDVLGFVAMMGLLLSMLLSSERLLRGPSTSRTAPTRVEPVSDLPSFAARGLPSSAYLLSGIASMAAAVAAVSLYEWSSAYPGAPTLAGLAAGALLGIGVLVSYAYRPPAESWEEVARARPPAHPAPVPRPVRPRRGTALDPTYRDRSRPRVGAEDPAL